MKFKKHLKIDNKADIEDIFMDDDFLSIDKDISEDD